MSDVLGQWAHAFIRVNTYTQKVTYRITDITQTTTYYSGDDIGFYDSDGSLSICNQIDFFDCANEVSSNIDNLRIDKYVNDGNYSYTIMTDGGNVLESGSTTASSSFTYYYPEFELRGSNLYSIARNINPYFGSSITLDVEDKVETVYYTGGPVKDVIFYSEAEDLPGVTAHADNNADIRCSNGKGAVIPSNIVLMNGIASGAYKAWGQAWGGKNESGEGNNVTFTIKGGENTIELVSTYGYLKSEEHIFVMSVPGDVVLNSASYINHAMLDNLYIQALFAFDKPSSIRTKGTTDAKPTLHNPSGASVTYTSSNNAVASVDASGTVNCKLNGVATITATATIDATTYTTTHTITVTGDDTATTAWNLLTGEKEETLTISGTGYLPEDAEGTSFDVYFGNPLETQYVVSQEGESAAYGIDVNGYKFVFLTYPGNAGVPTMGSYYSVKIKDFGGKLTVRGFLDSENGIRLVSEDGTVIEKITTVTVNGWEDYTFNTELAANTTYYIYAETGTMDSHNTSNYSTLYVNSFKLDFFKEETATIDVSKLFYATNKNAGNGLDRVIPKFSLSFKGGDGVKVNSADRIIFRENSGKKGCLSISPRLTNAFNRILFTNVTLTTPDITSGKVVVNGQSVTLSGTSTTINLRKPETDLTTGMFQNWDGTDEDAKPTAVVSTPELHLNTDRMEGDMIYGYSTVDARYYADLTGYQKIVIVGTPGLVLRVLMNRKDDGNFVEQFVEIDESRKGEMSFLGYEYVHLNAIKVNWSSANGQVNSIRLKGNGVSPLVIRYDGESDKYFTISQISLGYQPEGVMISEGLLDGTKVVPGMDFNKSIVYADGNTLAANTPIYSAINSFLPPASLFTYTTSDASVATVSDVHTGEGTMVTSDFSKSTTFKGSLAESDYFAADAATYIVKGTYTLPVNGTKDLTVLKGQEIEVIAFADGGSTDVSLSNTIGRLSDNSKAPLEGNLLLNSSDSYTSLNYPTTETSYYAYAKENGPVTLKNTGSYPIRLLSFNAGWRETENTINYKKYTDYKKYDDFTDEAGPFVYAGGFSLPAPTLKIVDVKTGEDVTSLYQLSPGSYVSNHSAAVVNSGTGELASTYTKASVTAITDVTISAAMQTTSDAWGFNPSAALTGPVRVYPYDMTWYFPTNSSTEGLQFTGNHAVSMVDSENRLNIIGNVISSVMIPVQKKQKVVVTAHAFRNDNGAGGNQTINLRNAADIYEEIASQTTYNWATVDYEYTAQEDGYLTLKNITREHYASGRTLSIQKIVVKPQEILFADGPEVSIGTTVGTGSYQNPIINPMDDEVTYSYSVDVSRLAIDASFDNSKGIFTANSSGELFKTTPLGDLVVSVTASKADLVHEQTGHYTLKVITYNFQKQELSNNYDGNPWAVTQLENPLESSASPVPGPDVIYYEYIEGNPKVDIDHTAGSTTYTVTVNGLGKVRIVAVSGVISTSFVMNSNYDPSSGKTDFVNTMPSVPYGTTTYSQFVQGWTHLDGENVVSDDDVTWTILEQTKGVSDWTITSPGGILSGSGTGWGVIKVQATKGGDSHTYCLTVQRPLSQSDTYTKQSTGENWSYNYYTWDFHSDRLHKYVADVDNNMTANSYISDDLANTVETTDWKWFQRKEDGTGNKTQYVHFYKPALLGDNGFVIPETIGLQIESAAFTRTTTGGGRKGFGIINVYESRTGEGGLSATPADAMTASGDRRGLSLQEGVTLTIPKLKAGWYVEMQWARLDPISGNRLQTTNLLDLNGNLVNTELLIGRCQDNLDHGGYYTFQVAGDPLDNDDYRDVSFTVMPKGYDDLYQIRVYDGDYQETMSEMKVGQNETNIADTDINDPSSPMQYYRILYDEDSDDVPPVNFTYANNLGSAVAPSRVSVSTEGPLEVELAYGVSHAPIAYGSSEREHGYYPYPMVKLLNDYGRFYITYTMFSEDRKYVVSRKTYRLKVGLVPHQQYPYTWNFTNISGGETLRKMNNAYNSIKPDGATWYAYGYNMFELNTTATDGSYYVPGATLVSSVRNLGSDGTREELMAAGEGCDEFNGLGFEGKIAFKTAAQDGDEEAATELTSGIQSSLLHYSMDDTSYDPAASVVLAAGNGHVKFGAPTKRTDASSHGVDGYSSGYSYLMDGGNTKNVLLIPQRAFRNGDVITIKGYYLVGDGSKGGFSFYETNTSTTPLATEYLTDVTANKLHTVVHTVTAGDGIAGLSEVYLFRADKTQPGMYLTEVEVTAGGGTEPVGYGRKLKCIGGPVTITIPDLNADGKLDWIYIKSSAAPTSIVKGETNATLVVNAATGGADAEEGVFKYKVPEEGSYLVTFAENTEIERIGVTHILKPITAVGTMGWATESRDIAIDHDLTGVLTKNDVNAYSVSVKSSDLQRVTVKLDAVNNNAASNDEQHNANRAVPAKAGIVLKLDATTNLSLANSGGVPLFVPAMSTSIVSYDNMKYSLSGNHMMANLTERTLLYEQETGEIDDDGDSFDDTGRASGDYTRFILAQRFISWKKTTLTEDDGAPTETTSHSSEFETLPTPAAVFYRLHKFEDSERSDYSDTEITSKTADLLNTLGDNKAYLLLPTGTLPKALWDTSGAGGAREFVAIQGVSDMEEELGEDGGLLRHRVDNRTYDLRGRVVDDGNLKPGVYIRGGKKFIVR